MTGLEKLKRENKNYKVKRINILDSNWSYELTPEWEYRYQELNKEVTNLKKELYLVKKDIDNYTNCSGLASLEKIKERAEISNEKETGIKRINIFDRIDFDIVEKELKALELLKSKNYLFETTTKDYHIETDSSLSEDEAKILTDIGFKVRK